MEGTETLVQRACSLLLATAHVLAVATLAVSVQPVGTAARRRLRRQPRNLA